MRTKKALGGKKWRALSVVGGLLMIAAACAGRVEAASVTIVSTPAAVTVAAGQSVTTTVVITRTGFADNVTFGAAGLPAGVTASFAPATTVGTSSVLKLQTAAATPLGTYQVTVKATAAGIAIAPATVTLTVVKTLAVGVAANPSAQSIVAGQGTYYDLTIDRTGFKEAVNLTAENLPDGVTAEFQPPSVKGATARMWLYSNGLPPYPQTFDIVVRARASVNPAITGVKAVRLRVNCDVVWAMQGFPENAPNADFATAVATDASGNIYAAGHVVVPATGATEIWAAKFTASGVRLWLRQLTLASVPAGIEKSVRALAVDAGGSIYLAGYTQTSRQTVNYDVFVVRLDAAGNQLAGRLLGSAASEDGTHGMELRFDAGGRAVLASAMNIRSMNVPVPAGGTMPQYSFDLNIITLSSALATVASSSPLVGSEGLPGDAAFAPDGSVYVVLTSLNINQSRYEAYLQKIGPNGTPVWSRLIGIEYYPRRVAADALGNVFVGGDHNTEAWIARFAAADGSQQFVVRDDTPGLENFGDLAADGSGNVVYTGKTTGSLAAANPDSGTKTDGYLAKRAPDGTLFFIRQFAVVDKDTLDAIALDSAGSAILAGSTVNFNNVNYGFEDVLLMKFSLTPYLLLPVITTLGPGTVTGGQPFTIGGTTLSGAEAVYFNGQPIPYTINSDSKLTATAPLVTANTPGVVTVAVNCQRINAPMTLTVTP
ncbi:MAG: hypothetical protein JSS81_01675 [Acidobacteria bacterium]|nr:hypothetical protein [Acidobacteriota bacterium]